MENLDDDKVSFDVNKESSWNFVRIGEAYEALQSNRSENIASTLHLKAVDIVNYLQGQGRALDIEYGLDSTEYTIKNELPTLEVIHQKEVILEEIYAIF